MTHIDPTLAEETLFPRDHGDFCTFVMQRKNELLAGAIAWHVLQGDQPSFNYFCHMFGGWYDAPLEFRNGDYFLPTWLPGMRRGPSCSPSELAAVMEAPPAWSPSQGEFWLGERYRK